MAVTSIWPIKFRLDKVINYIRNPERITEEYYAENAAMHVMKPSPSQYKPLIRSRRLPQNRNSVLVNGSSSNSCCTMAASPSIPFRMSV